MKFIKKFKKKTDDQKISDLLVKQCNGSLNTDEKKLLLALLMGQKSKEA